MFKAMTNIHNTETYLGYGREMRQFIETLKYMPCEFTNGVFKHTKIAEFGYISVEDIDDRKKYCLWFQRDKMKAHMENKYAILYYLAEYDDKRDEFKKHYR